MKRNAITLLLILLFSVPYQVLIAQENQQQQNISFWHDVDVDFGFHLSSFSGDFESFDNIIGLSPVPFNGMKFDLAFVKPLRQYSGITPRASLGLSVMNYSSKTRVNARYNFDDARGGLGPINISNVIVGPELGFKFDIGLFRSLKMSPSLGFGYYFNMPRTDGFVDADGNVTRGGSTNRYTRDFRLNTGTVGVGTGETIPGGIGAVMAGGRLSFELAGTEFYLSYQYKRFLSPYFDGVNNIATSNSTNYSMLTGAGVRLPLNRGIRNDQLGRDFSSQLYHLRRNMDTNNQEHLDEFFKTFDDLVYDKNSLGLTFNRLASKVQIVELPLGNTNMMLEFSRIPGSTFILGHNDEDPFQIQNYGRLRVSVQDFLMSRTTITNKHYRLFLLAMGHTFDGSDRLQRYLTGESMPFNEVVRNARLAGVTLPEGIALNSVSDLLPDEASWNAQNLGNILSFEQYLYSPEFDDYPVVGINWYQAMMFSAWAGFRLPLEVEWEYAAKSGVGGRTFPWDGYNAQDERGNYLANYMQERGVFNLDGYTLMAPVRAFPANEFGLFNMAGNVSEWVADSYSSTYQVLRRDQIMVTPANLDFSEQRKVHRGGSWASSLFFIGSGVRNHQFAHRPSPTVGFRVATSRFIDTGTEELDISETEEEPLPEPENGTIPIPDIEPDPFEPVLEEQEEETEEVEEEIEEIDP